MVNMSSLCRVCWKLAFCCFFNWLPLPGLGCSPLSGSMGRFPPSQGLRTGSDAKWGVNEGWLRVPASDVCGVSLHYWGGAQNSPGQEECRGAPHPPTCAKPSPHPHRLTDTVAGLVRAGQLLHSRHRLQPFPQRLLTLAGRKPTASAQLRRTGRPRYRHPLSLALSLNPPILLLSRLPFTAVHLARAGRDCGATAGVTCPAAVDGGKGRRRRRECGEVPQSRCQPQSQKQDALPSMSSPFSSSDTQ